MYRLSAPSKSFLVGEYVALHGGPALVLCTTPRFFVTATQSAKAGIHNFSTAAQVLVQNLKLEDLHLDFFDPHHRRGGFGASGAEVLLLAELRRQLDGKNIEAFELLDQVEQLKHSIGWSLGSGYDVLAMCAGRVAYVERSSKTLESLEWPFKNLSWCLLRGRVKVPTHDHLATWKDEGLSDLELAVEKTVEAFKNASEDAFVEGVKETAQQLQRLNLVHSSVKEELAFINKMDGVVAAKGCGAMGADTQIVIFEKSKQKPVLDELSKRFEVLDSILSPGLQIERIS